MDGRPDHDPWAASRGERLALAALFAVGIALRLAHLGQPMRHDEAYTYLEYAMAPISSALSDYEYPNNHLFHTLLVWLTTRVAGGSAVAIRFPAFLAGVLLVPAVHRLAVRQSDRSAALVATGLAAAWPALVLYSTNARGYSLVALAFVVLLLLGERAIEGGGRSVWIGIASVVAIGLYTLPVMLYPAGAAMVWILAESARRHGWAATRRLGMRMAGALLLAGVATAVAYLPVVRRSGIASLVSNRYVVALSPGELLAALPPFAGDLAVSLGLGIPFPVLALLAAAALAGAFAWGDGRAGRLVLAASVLGWCAFLLLLTRRPPPSRVWLFLVPLGCVYMGRGLTLLGGPAVRTGRRATVLPAAIAVGVAIALGGWTLATGAVFRSPETGTLVAAQDIARYLITTLGPGDRVVVQSPTGPPLDYSLLRLGGPRLDTIDARAARGRVFVLVNARHLQTLASVQGGARELPWAELSPDGDPVAFPSATVHAFRFTRPR